MSNQNTLLTLTQGHLFLSLGRLHSTTDQISKYVFASQFDFFYSNIKYTSIILEKKNKTSNRNTLLSLTLGPPLSEFSKPSFNNLSNIKICFGFSVRFLLFQIQIYGYYTRKEKTRRVIETPSSL